jgi:uncharacterized membrane-anchored protein
MRRLLIACLGLLAFGLTANAKVPQNEEERSAAVKALAWKDGQKLTLPVSRGTLKAPDDIRQLQGADSVSLWEILNGDAAPHGIEATLYDPATKGVVFYEKLGDGYVRLDDWHDIEADAMLKSVSADTDAGNAKRRAAGIPTLRVVGWLQRPHLDRATNTVRWSVEAMDERDGSLVNSVALVLGRDGFEKLTWIGSKDDVGKGLLDVALASFSFPAGGLYTDFQPSDKVAEYGIASLVAAMLGAKVAAKLGVLAALVVLAKKFGVLLLVPVVAVGVWLRRLFSRQKPPPASPRP